ncbi:hypothetical protein OUZ56_003603 [Daphnia magna]|uniref:Uncharacterized protein n=1 Tax=Daphnia magna TaxID=35525 RepID=A0ABR0A970_9CRUS|nr:hypothetical protein OUZ56_003603 [Daphnia magna]
MDVVGPQQARRRLNLAFNRFVNDASLEEVNCVGQSGYAQVETGNQVPVNVSQANNLNIDLLPSTSSTLPFPQFGIFFE